MTQTGVSQRVLVVFCRVHVQRFLALSCLLLAMGSSAWAEELHVGVEEQYQTIQAAVDVANDNDTILVHPGTYTTETGNAVVMIMGGATDEGLQTGNTLTIKSVSGPEHTVIDGGSVDEAKRRGIIWQDVNGTLDGFTIRNCNLNEMQNTNPFGAGMLVKDTGVGTNNIITVSVKNCVFLENVNDEGNGGGLAMDLKHTASGTDPDTVVPCVVEDCVFTKNFCDGAAIGAGMWITGANIEIRHTEFTENNPDRNGRRKATGVGLGASESVAVITECSFTNNVSGIDSVDDSGDGGGAWFNNCSLEISLCTFRENEVAAGGGGGVSIVNNGDQTVVITECVIESNMSEQGGGLSFSGPDIKIEKTYFGENAAEEEGGGMKVFSYPYSPRNAAEARFDRCVFKENDSATAQGGGAYIEGNMPTDEDENADPTVVHFRGCSFIENSSMTWGGGLACADQNAGLAYELTCSHSLFMCNRSAKGGGAGIEYYIDSVTFAQCLMWRNQATAGSGGGVWMNQSGSSYIAENPESTFCTCSFQANTAVYEGVGDDVAKECTDCRNSDAIGCGGGLWISGGSWKCPNDGENPDFYYDCLHFLGNSASYACTDQYRHPGCDEGDEGGCNTDVVPDDDEDPVDTGMACSFKGTSVGPSVIDLDCTLNPLSHLFDACPGDITGDGLVDGSDLSILLGEWGTNPGCSDSDAPYPLTCGNPSLERMDIDDAPIGEAACCGSEPDCAELDIDPDWLERAGGGQCSDFNRDGIVDGADLSTLLGAWGPCE
jgi:hypothetical protein